MICTVFMVLGLIGCEKQEPEVKKIYTENQEKVFDILDGSFQHVYVIISTPKYGDIYEFKRRYDTPKEFYGETYMGGKELAFVAHGEGKFKDITTGTMSYSFYYHVTESGGGLEIYKVQNSYNVREKPYKDCTLNIINKDKFTIYFDSALPAGGIETYERMK